MEQIARIGSVALVLLLAAPSTGALAQEEEELPPWLRDDTEVPTGPEEPQPDNEPSRILLSVGGGATIRLIKDDDFQQDQFAPSFIDLWGAFILPGHSSFRHGPAVGLATNLSGDGGESLGLNPMEQWVIAPGYVARLAFSGAVPDFAVLIKAAIPMAIVPRFSPGFEVSGTFAYMFLAGFGAYVEVSASLYLGGKDNGGSMTIHPLVSGELGLYIDYELLP